MVYIIKLERPIGGANHRAQYYCGYCAKGRLSARLREHRSGDGAKMLAAASQKGIGFDVVWTLPHGTRGDERRIKNQKSLSRFVARQGGVA